MHKYTHLTIEERDTIQYMLWEKKSIRAIAKELGRSPSSISRELKKNFPSKRKRYTSHIAQGKAQLNRSSRGRKNRLKSQEVRDYVHQKLKLEWSPEQIAGTIKKEIGISLSHEAIYQYIYHQITSYNRVKEGSEDFRSKLRRRHRNRRKKGFRQAKAVPRFDGTSIEKRPIIVNKKKRIGDWETDTVESSNHKPGVNTLLERKSGLYFITKLKSKNSTSTRDAIIERLKDLPAHTITADNGSENAAWRELEETLKTKTYFCHPYCSGERGANENTNGLLRQYFPKKTDFTKVSEEELRHVEYLLNTRPRKRLNYQTPLQVFYKETGVALTY